MAQGTAGKAGRQERLAQALRENLRKRKEQDRGREERVQGGDDDMAPQPDHPTA